MKKHILVFIIFLISFSIFLFFNPTYTGFVIYQPVQPDLALELTTTTYSSGDELDGNLIITTKGRLREDTLVKLEINGEETEESLTSLLDNLVYYDVDLGSSYVTNAETEKELVFSSSGSKEVAFKVQKRATVDSIDLKLEGVNSPKFPTLDFFADGTEELIYLGNALPSWPTEKLFSDDLDLGEEGTASVNLQEGVYYCELIELPYAKNFKIISRYNGDIAKGKILPITIDQFGVNAKSYGDTGCTFNLQSDWSYCTVNFDKPIYGEHLVCIYSELSGTYVEIEQSRPFSGYKCDIYHVENVTGDTCRKAEAGVVIGDFFVGVIKREYEGILEGSVLLSDYSPELILDSINDYLSTCSKDLCEIPIKVSSKSAGTVKLSDLSVYYGDKFTDKLFDSEITFPTIYEINNENLDDEDVNITIPLDLFDITVPDISDDTENLTLEITLGSESVSEEIEVYKTTEVPSLESVISIFEDYTLDQRAVAKVYGVDVDLTLINLQDFETKIQDIEDSSLSESVKQNQIEIITDELEDYLPGLPLSIKMQKSFKNIPLGPSEVKDDYLLESQRTQAIKDQIQLLQSKVSMKTDILSYKIVFEDVTEEKTLIKKTISGDLDDVYIIEEIPKVEASSVNDIKFGTDNYEIIEEDPIVRWYVNSLPFTIIYSLPSEFVSDIKDFSTLIFPKDISFEPSEKYKQVRCGDGRCTIPLEDRITCPEDCAKRINWTFVIILLLVLIAGIYYLNFYRGRYSFKKLQVPKRVFKSETDEINLMNYVKKSVNLRVPKAKIKKVLLAKGWSERQVDHVFDKLYKY